jgi:flagellar basal-body rod modification protein FlgD
MNIAAFQNAIRNTPATAHATSANNTSSGNSSAGSVSITANDFLTILVTELQNQDPTSDQDPNEYVNQLVQINSLEQLIQINTGVGSLGTGVADLSTSLDNFASSIGASSPSSEVSRTPITDISNHASTNKAAAIANALVPNHQS